MYHTCLVTAESAFRWWCISDEFPPELCWWWLLGYVGLNEITSMWNNLITLIDHR